ncbi:MAG: universal stress protein [Ktedonobacteraceae bacterium]
MNISRTMNISRWLLPFTSAMDMRALDAVVRLAESHGATLVAVSLITVPHESRTQGVRLEYIQQSKDFLETVQYKAARQQVPVERYEVFTADVVRSMKLLAHEQHCSSIVLVTRGEKDSLLQRHELRQVLDAPPMSLVFIRLPAHTQPAWLWPPVSWFTSGLRRLRAQLGDLNQAPDMPALEEPSWIRTEEPSRIGFMGKDPLSP